MYYVTFDKRGSHICCTMNLVLPYYTHYRPIIRYLHVQCIQIVIYVDVYTISYYATVLYVSYEITHKKHITAYGTLQYLLTHHQIKRKKQQKRCRNAIFLSYWRILLFTTSTIILHVHVPVHIMYITQLFNLYSIYIYIIIIYNIITSLIYVPSSYVDHHVLY